MYVQNTRIILDRPTKVRISGRQVDSLSLMKDEELCEILEVSICLY